MDTAGHTQLKLAWSPNGNDIAVGGADGAIEVFDPTSGQLIQSLSAPAQIRDLVWLEDGQYLGALDGDDNFQLWELPSFNLLKKWSLRFAGPVYDVDWSNVAVRLASSEVTGNVGLWYLSGFNAALLELHQGITSVAWSPDGEYVALGSNQGPVHIWSAFNTPKLTLNGATDTVWAVDWSSNGELIAAGSADHAVRIWNAGDGALLRTLTDHANVVNAVQWSPDGTLLASAGDDRTLRFWGVPNVVAESASTATPLATVATQTAQALISPANTRTSSTRAVYFVSGHGELSITDTAQTGLSQLKTALESVNLQVRTLDVINQTLPSDASSIVIAGPVHAYTESEVKTIGAYLAGGGKAVMLIDPSPVMGLKAGDPDPLAAYLSATWGLALRNDIVVDSTQHIPELGTLAPSTVTYGASPITKGLDRVVSFFPTNRSIGVPDGTAVPAGVSLVTLVKSGPNAWGETNFDSINAGNAAPDGADVTGELALAVTAENSKTGARLVVFGGSGFAMNGFANQGANSTLLLNAVKWATDSDH